MKTLSVVAALVTTAALLVPADLHADPSGRVARVSYVAGQVSLRHGTEAEWMQFVINYPVTTGDQIWTDAGARSELHIGSTALRLSELTALSVTMIEDDRVHLVLSQGTLGLRVRVLDSDDHLEVETPAGTIAIRGAGEYRVDVDSLGASAQLTVRRGAAEVLTASGSFAVHEGQSARITGDPSPSYDVHDAPGMGDFDAWSAQRDRLEDESESARYISREMTGYEELDRYGQWEDAGEYGAVWVPAGVARGWAPYRYGYWAWVNPWGWTWIDEAPWGFAPFHYGRWARYRGRWVWVPGARVVRPVYAPALVVFVGGGGWSASGRFGPGGGVAWFPLAPGEPWVPGYHASQEYVRNVNVTNVNVTNINVTNVNVTNVHYRNRDVEGAVTAVPHEVFVSAHGTRGAAVAVGVRELDGATVVSHAPPVAPRHESEVIRMPSHESVWHAPQQPANAHRWTPPSPAAVRAPTAHDAQPDAASRKQERAVADRQVREHAQLEEHHEQERSAPPRGVSAEELRARQQREAQQMEARHTAELRAVPPRPPVATAPRQPPKPPAAPKNEAKNKEPEKHEKPAKPPR